MKFHHIPVLFNETINMLACKEGDRVVDGTLGGGGHAGAILERIAPGGILIGIDRDPNALSAAKESLKKYKASMILFHDNFANIKSILKSINTSQVDGILLDLGVSSHQLDQGERGFSYKIDAPLDMRMDPSQELSAYKVVNEYDERRLSEIISNYGEERWALRIAKFIIKKRPINTTVELTDAIKAAIPVKARARGPHPSKRTFQAIRIEVNKELEILKLAIEDCIDSLKSGGRLCIISFHSLEDRIVKNTFRSLENPCTCPPDSPICICGKRPSIKIITRRPLIATEDELETNPRSRSAKLRVCEKL